MNCRICDSPMYVEETVSNCLLGYITLQDSPHNIELQDLTIYYCPYCSHRQTENNLPANYYSAQKDGHDKFNGFKQYYGTLQQTEFKIAKLAQYGKYQKNFLDIGCGEGQTLEIAEKYFGNCVGVEPTHSDTKKENIINAYFDKDFKLDDYLPDQSATNNEYFSAFAAMQVFEHLEDVYSVLETAYSYLCEGGVGLINVPNGQLIYDNKFYHQVLGEHLNYFSPFSLALMAHKAGFDVIEIESINSTMELDLYIKKKTKDNNGFNQVKQKHKAQLNEHLNEVENITIWGAGAKSVIYNQLIPDSCHITHLVDSDETKIGKYVSEFMMPIESASQTIIDESDVVLIFASSYNDEIIRKLHRDYHYRGKIVYFEGESVKCVKDKEL